ncbi:hypothetical protein JCM10049v2_003240 [Rhodotorula toruloides]
MSEPGPSARRERRQAVNLPRAARRVPPPPPMPLEPPENTAPLKPAPKLPAELIQSIVDYACEDLQPSAERKTCRNLALVGRDWREIAQRRIFREVAIASTDALARAAAIFSNPPCAVGRFVRDLALHLTLEEPRQEDLAQLYETCKGLSSLNLTANHENMCTLVSSLLSTPAGRAVGVMRLRLAEYTTPAVDLSIFDELNSLPNLTRWQTVIADALTLSNSRINGHLFLTQLYIGFAPVGDVERVTRRLVKHGTPHWDLSELRAGDLCFWRLGKQVIQAIRAASSITSLRIFDCRRGDIDDICDILNAYPVLENFDIEGEMLSTNETQQLFEAIPRSLITANLELGGTFKTDTNRQLLHNFLQMRKSAALRRVRLPFLRCADLWTKDVRPDGSIWKPNGRPERKNGAQKRKVDKSGLGRAIINRKVRAARDAQDPTLHSSEIAAGLSSVTQENDLDEFLSTAQLAETDFSAERQNIKVVSDPSLNAASHNPYLLTPQQEAELRTKQNENQQRLQVPRRPPWTRQMTTVELERQERDAFLEWRRGLADLQDNQALLLTPFERNLEVWRQLWRTLERSDLIVQIVDARNPLTFRSADLEKYVLELNELERPREEGEPAPKRKNLLLINKSDLLTRKQREEWADYFEANGIQYAFFSAANGIALQEERARQEELANGAEESSDEEDEDEIPGMKIPKSGNKLKGLNAKPKTEVAPAPRRRVVGPDESSDEEDEDDSDEELASIMRRGMGISLPGSDESERTRILSVLELEELFLSHAPEVSLAKGHGNEKLVVGLVGYPNVGKSSTINALIGEKKVSVSSTPGKTKHFQTIRLSPDVLLCDCPGLVFPQFAATKADLVCNGVLPIDQLREFTGPVELVTRRIPQEVLEGTYGLRITILPENEGGTGVPTAAEFLNTFSIARGFFTGGQGNPDQSRSSRLVLKDYVNGKLLYCHPPPGIDSDDFNRETRDIERLRAQNKLKRKMAPMTRVSQKSDYYVHNPAAAAAGAPGGGRPSEARGKGQSAKANALDNSFFGADVGKAVIAGLKGKKLNAATGGEDKKHFKKKREKQRSGRGYEV